MIVDPAEEAAVDPAEVLYIILPAEEAMAAAAENFKNIGSRNFEKYLDLIRVQV